MIVDIARPLADVGPHTLLQQITELIEAGNTKLVLKLSETTYLSSVGLGTLVHLAHLAEQAGGRILLADITPRDAEILALIELDDVLQVVELSEEDLA